MAKKYTKEQIEQMIIAECKKWGVNPALALGIAKHESGLRADALSPKNKNGTRDQGVFQLNNAYFKLKNWSDPVENISRGVQHIAALQKTFRSDIDKILMAYNAGAGAVQSGKVPSVTKNNYVPNVKKQIASYDSALAANNGTLNRTVQSIENIATGGKKPMMNNSGNITGAASGIQIPQATLNQLQANPTSTNELIKLMESAREGDKAVFDRFNQVSQQALSRYDMPVQVGIDPETQEPIMMSPRQIDILKQQGIDAGLNVARQQALGVINPYTQEAQNYSQGMYDRLNNYYQQQLNAINAANPTGYQGITPEQVRENTMRARGLNEFAAAFSGNPATYAQTLDGRTQRQLQADQLAYQQMIANQAGIPFEQYMAMKNAEANTAQNMVNQIGALSQQDMQRLGTSATAAQNLYKADVDMAKARIDQIQKEREFDQKLIDTYGTQYADLLKQQMINNGTYLDAMMGYTQATDVAGINRSSNLGGNIISGEYGLNRQELSNAGDLAVAQTQGENQYRTQQLKGGQDYTLKMAELEHPTNVIPKAAQAYSDFSFGQAMNPTGGNTFFTALPTNFTSTYFPNLEQAAANQNQGVVNQNPTGRDALFGRLMYGNLR